MALFLRWRICLGCYFLIAFTGSTANLGAQQYCASGTVLSAPTDIFKVGDEITVTATVQRDTESCTTSADGSLIQCTANILLKAQNGSRKWTSAGLPPVETQVVASSFSTDNGATFTSQILFGGSANLSPLPSPPPSDSTIGVLFELASYPSNLLAGNTLPDTLPLPDMISSSGAFLVFQVAFANVSYTTQSCGVTIVDPVPDLLNGPEITTAATAVDALPGQPYLGDTNRGRVVSGVATDGIAQVVLRIAATSPGETFSVALRPDQCIGSVNCSDDYGLVFDPTLPPPNIFTDTANQTITVTSVSTSSGPMAFAAYRAPVDFVRTGGNNLSDQGAAERSVFISITSQQNGPLSDQEIKLVRPPVVLIHGLWGDGSAWATFSTLTTDPRFSAGIISYDTPVVGITASNPDYSAAVLSNVYANSLGFAYNAPAVLNSIKFTVADFRHGLLPNGGNGPRVASVQADVVSHSMGGDIIRFLPTVAAFDTSDTYGQGVVHKVITIGTPHLGSPIATQLLQPANKCVRDILANDKGLVAGNTFSIGSTAQSAAVGDLEGDGLGGALSPALAVLQSSDTHPIRTAFIAGTTNETNLAGLDSLSHVAPIYIRTACGHSPLANVLTSDGWNILFSGQPNDAIVPLSSARNNEGTYYEVTGVVHSTGTEGLGFNGPSLLDSSEVMNDIVKLLNSNVINSGMFIPLKP